MICLEDPGQLLVIDNHGPCCPKDLIGIPALNVLGLQRLDLCLDLQSVILVPPSHHLN